MTEEQTDRKALVKLSVKRLQEQARGIEKDIERDIEFIEDWSERLKHLITSEAKKEANQRIAERMIRVDNLRVTQQMIALTLELLEQEQKRLQEVTL